MQGLFQRYYRSVKVLFSRYPGVMENWNWAPLNTDQLTERTYTNHYHVINAFANYEKHWGRHNLKAMVGFNQELQQYKNVQARGGELLSESLNDLNFSTTAAPRIEGGASEWAIRGGFYRLNYDYAGKYLVEASGRYDGTSRFPEKSRFGFFPSFSAGYRISEETFFDPLKVAVSNLKIRYSYGSLGNQDVSNYAYVSEMATRTPSWLQNGSNIRAVGEPAPVASTLTWETAVTNNAGVDADFLNSRLSLTADFYIRDTKDMLMEGKQLPAVFGANEPKENAADLRTKGYEISLTWRDKLKVAGKPFAYNITAIFSDASAKITKFDNPAGLISGYRVGQELGEIWGYRFDGFFATDEEAQEYAQKVNMNNVAYHREARQAGDLKILDLNDDNIISSGAGTVENPGDREIIGNTTARYSYGLSAGLNWNGIDIYVLLQGIGQKHWYPSGESSMFWGPYSRAYASFIPADFQEKIWSPDHPDAYYPRLIGYLATGSELSQSNDMYLQDVAYCKLRNLTIGYTLPNFLLGKVGIDRLRVYVSGDNIFTWTKLDNNYVDPEETMVYSDARTYPMGKTYSLGIEISF
jgi:TonB-linked SusC/RagA family outer membrane protein